jgi:FKBP-type peptidyl-prolyl cis-trans isomerase FkpA
MKNFYLFFLIAFISCSTADENAKPTKAELKDPLIRVNKYLLDKDIQQINSYAKRRNWNVIMSNNGLFYDIYHKTNGLFVEPGMNISIKYKLNLMDGTACYNSDSLGLRKFVVGNGQVEIGLEQALLLMKKGEKARIIIPPHLAFGVPGDGNKIPPRSTIVYHVEIIDISY